MICKTTARPMETAIAINTLTRLMLPPETSSICWTKMWTAGSAKTPNTPKAPPRIRASHKSDFTDPSACPSFEATGMKPISTALKKRTRPM